MKHTPTFLLALILLGNVCAAQTYIIVDTGQIKCYNNSGKITAPSPGQPFYGQDAQFFGNQSSYTLRSPKITLTPPVKTDRIVYSNITPWVATVTEPVEHGAVRGH